MKSFKEIINQSKLLEKQNMEYTEQKEPYLQKPGSKSFFGGAFVVDYTSNEYGRWVPNYKYNHNKLKEIALKQIQTTMLPAKFRNTKFNEDLYNIVSNGKSIILNGKVGVGKTYKMYEIANRFAYNSFLIAIENNFEYSLDESNVPFNYPVRVYTTPEIVYQMKKEFDESTPTKLMDILMRQEVLFLDDIGVEKVTDWWLEQFSMLINYRYVNMKPMVITTNLKFKGGELAKYYDDRIASRLYEMSSVITIEGEDRRFN